MKEPDILLCNCSSIVLMIRPGEFKCPFRPQSASTVHHLKMLMRRWTRLRGSVWDENHGWRTGDEAASLMSHFLRGHLPFLPSLHSSSLLFPLSCCCCLLVFHTSYSLGSIGLFFSACLKPNKLYMRYRPPHYVPCPLAGSYWCPSRRPPRSEQHSPCLCV